ncbi:MAG: hypothetical protein IPM85_11660 [Chitinophagaceae bacterium]|nr:hypothetical protein [Chitinophagaceae bacterium]
MWANSTPFGDHQAAASVSTSYPSTTSGYELLTKTYYDSYTGIPAGMAYTTDYNAYFQSDQ